MSSPKKRRRAAPQPLAAAIWSVVGRHVAADTIRLLHVQEAWPAVAGPALAARTFPVAVGGDVVVVHVHDSQWLHELTYMRQDLLRRLQTLVPSAGLQGLRLRLGELPPVSRRAASDLDPDPGPPPLTPPRFSPEPDAATRAALDAVADPDLKQILAGARVMLGRP